MDSVQTVLYAWDRIGGTYAYNHNQVMKQTLRSVHNNRVDLGHSLYDYVLVLDHLTPHLERTKHFQLRVDALPSAA